MAEIVDQAQALWPLPVREQGCRLSSAPWDLTLTPTALQVKVGTRRSVRGNSDHPDVLNGPLNQCVSRFDMR